MFGVVGEGEYPLALVLNSDSRLSAARCPVLSVTTTACTCSKFFYGFSALGRSVFGVVGEGEYPLALVLNSDSRLSAARCPVLSVTTTACTCSKFFYGFSALGRSVLSVKANTRSC